MSWDVTTADMKYHVTMSKNEGEPLNQRRKINNKAFCWDNVCVVCLVVMALIIDLHVTGWATHLNLLDWLLNNAFQRELYVKLH